MQRSQDTQHDRPAQGLTQRTLGGLFWASSGALVQLVLQVATLVLFARLLTPADFGLIGAAMVIIGFGQIFAQLSVGSAIVQRARLAARHVRTGFTLSLLLGMLLSGLMVVLAPLIAQFFRMSALTPVVQALAPIFLLRGVGVVAAALLQRNMRFRLLARVEIISFGIGYGVVGLTLAWLGYGVWALVGAHLGQVTLETMMLLIAQPHPKRFAVNRRACRELMAFGSGFTMAKVANFFALQGDNMVVGRWLGADALGLYSRAYRLMSFPANLFGETVERVLFPALSQAQDDDQRLSMAYRRGMALTALLVMPASAIAIVLGPELVHVALGPSWKGAVLPLQVLAVGMFFRTGYKLSGTLARAKGAVHRLAFYHAIYAVLVVAGAWIGHWAGLAGVAWGVVGALAIQYLLLARLSISVTSLRWREFIGAHASAVALTVVVAMIVWSVAAWLRGWEASAALVLIGALIAVGMSLCVLIWLAPVFWLGKDGVWWLHTLSRYGSLDFKLLRYVKT
ncbi:MAG: lipopolysaccharide biosynthesis protein [Acidobacteriota bacterium]|nr:oligosaccharide flippase family protein [Blastocatellia bacterium]MDW8238674.1 lipopolysaccharide biosynthesis protein [Acidobacteriota bacterium]